jgi:hypothetical protein
MSGRIPPNDGTLDATPAQTSTYDAFISYAHGPDGHVAVALERGLQAMARRWNQIRSLRIFLDRGSLSPNSDLRRAIENSLRSSRYFILLASPSSAGSEWVDREVEIWQRTREPETFIIALAGGTVHWSDADGDFDWTRTNALPARLAGWFDSEPLWVEFEWAKSQNKPSIREARFRAAVTSIAATIHGVSPDELDSEDIRQHRFFVIVRRVAFVAIAMAVVLSLGATGYAGRQNLVAHREHSLAKKQQDLADKQHALAEKQRALAAERGLLTTADAKRQSDPRTSLLLNIAAATVTGTPEPGRNFCKTL